MLTKIASGVSTLIAATALCACTTVRPAKSAHTSVNPFLPANALTMHPPTNVKIVVGGLVKEVDPIYPSRLLQRNMPQQTVCLALSIDPEGHVYQTVPIYDVSSGCPAIAAAVAPAFMKAARVAVAHWRFDPTLRCTFPEGVDSSKRHVDCRAEGATVAPIAIRRAFIFTFIQVNGVTQVKVGHVDR